MATYELIEGFEQMDLSAVHAYLVRSYWAGEIPLELVRKAAQNSLCFGVRWNNHQVAFARVVTDKATFAYLSDVYVLEEHRGRGLSRMMMTTSCNTPTCHPFAASCSSRKMLTACTLTTDSIYPQRLRGLWRSQSPTSIAPPNSRYSSVIPDERDSGVRVRCEHGLLRRVLQSMSLGKH